jgi:cytoskeletal protein CcmA (bactofilin family)
MLDARKAKNYNENKVVSIIGPGTLISGEINSKGTIRIEGNVTGRIQCEDSIVVQETGRVKADLIGGQVIISGEVIGNVFAHERLEITPQGKVQGDITAPRISIAEGVLFEGKCTMKSPSQVRPDVAGGAEQRPAPQKG